MTAQLGLELPQQLLSESPIAATKDPFTSHKAAREITASGERACQQNRILGAVSLHPGLTSAELAQRIGCDRFTPARRLPELRAGGLVENGKARACAVTRKTSLTWYVRGTAPAQVSGPSPHHLTSPDTAGPSAAATTDGPLIRADAAEAA